MRKCRHKWKHVIPGGGFLGLEECAKCNKPRGWIRGEEVKLIRPLEDAGIPYLYDYTSNPRSPGFRSQEDEWHLIARRGARPAMRNTRTLRRLARGCGTPITWRIARPRCGTTRSDGIGRRKKMRKSELSFLKPLLFIYRDSIL